MLKRIHIENFLSCRDILLDNLTGVIALIGRNGSGKTNILQAIQWAVNSSCYAHDFGESEAACHFERSKKSAGFRFLATLEMTATTSMSEALCVT